MRFPHAQHKHTWKITDMVKNIETNEDVHTREICIVCDQQSIVFCDDSVRLYKR